VAYRRYTTDDETSHFPHIVSIGNLYGFTNNFLYPFYVYPIRPARNYQDWAA
jgi:hypothetical protein